MHQDWKDCMLRRGVWIYTYLDGTTSVSEAPAPSLSPVGSGDNAGGSCVGIWFSCPSQSGGGAHVPFRLMSVCGFCAGRFWPGGQMSVGSSQTAAGCLSIAAFPFLSAGNWSPHFFSSWTPARDFSNRIYISHIVVHRKPPLAILAIFNPRCMSECSSCTRPPCVAIVADMLKTEKKLVAPSKNESRLLPLASLPQ